MMPETTGCDAGSIDWGTAVVVDPKELRRLQDDSRKLRSKEHRRAVAAILLIGASALSVSVAYRQYSSVSKLRLKFHECRQSSTRTNTPSCASLEP